MSSRATDWVRDLQHDVRLSVRSMVRLPAFTIVHICLISVSVALACSAFSVLDAVLLRSLPGVVEPDRLVLISGLGARDDRIGPPLRVYQYLRELRDGTSHIFAYRNYGALPATIDGTATAVRGIGLVDDYFGGLGRVPLVIGRAFDPTSHDPVAIISHRIWQEQFGGARDVLGRTFTLGTVTFSVVGVAEQDFLGTQPDLPWDVLAPFDVLNRARGIAPSAMPDLTLYAVARLKPGITAAQYQATIVAAWPRILEATVPPKTSLIDWRNRRGSQPIVESFRRGQMFTLITQPGLPRALILTMSLSVLIFFASCVTLALLAVARGIRNQEHASIKLALGGTRWRLIRPDMIEAAILSVMGAGFGLLITIWAIEAAQDFVPGEWAIAVRSSTIIMAIVMATVTFVIGTGIASYLASKATIRDMLQAANRGSQAHVRLRGALLVAQYAVSVILICSTLFYVEDLQSLVNVKLGLDVNNLHVFSLAGRLPQRNLDSGYFEQLASSLRTLPGIESAAVGGTAPPLSYVRDFTEPVHRTDGRTANAFVSCLFPGVFETWGTRIVMGRDLEWRGRPSAVVSQSLAKRLFPDRNPLGEMIGRARRDSPELEVVGIVDDMAYNGPRLGVRDIVFMSCLDYVTPWPSSNVTQIYIRSPRTLSELEPGVAKVVDALGFQYIYVRADEAEYVDSSMARERMLATLGGAFGGMILVLTGMGLYAFCSYMLFFRHRELAIRSALGAGVPDIVRALLTETGIVLAIGLSLGVAAAFALNRVAASLVMEVGNITVRHSIEAILILVAIAATATVLPVTRALRVNLARALRVD